MAVHELSTPHSKVLPFLFGLFWLKCCIIIAISGETVYFDKYGHCQRSGRPFDLEDDDYRLKSTGGDDAHESLNCEMTFRGPSDSGVCLTFQHFEISHCGVNVKIYTSRTASGTVWRTLSCHSRKPSQMCTTGNYVTVKVSKAMLTHNEGYEFEIEVEKSNAVTADKVLFASIGVFIGIVLGVVLLIAIVAGLVLYCCCYHKQRGLHDDYDEVAGPEKGDHHLCLRERSREESLTQPSAPPVDDAWIQSDESLRMISNHQQNAHELPPPYVPPPPYYEDGYHIGRSSAPALHEEDKRSFVS
ncbi:hypothetical protein PoB_007105100 [Plakobranchus ocellatus]|uniref:CUB domain-containing protein n=1 Tax=Plakobranchus ocellatus TaxID=259542 RepID=A0AAV4DKP9_9GAST|nr:hypothetical protein PoB_007105100 [Plakobranchus ocellatus]